tara:strand:- start:484 stop:870 length:387 start_codon:yes stop_codon:yes gene_type:complete
MDNRFVENAEIFALIDQIPKGKRYSDIENLHGNQYVNLVQESGGVLGIALVGSYTYILEKAGIRFMNLVGTSAGTINTMMMAGLGRIDKEKSEKNLTILNNQPLFDLVDGDQLLSNGLSIKSQKKKAG